MCRALSKKGANAKRVVEMSVTNSRKSWVRCWGFGLVAHLRFWGGWLAFVLFFLLAVTMCEVQAQPVLLSDEIRGRLTSAQVDQREHLAVPKEKAGCHVQGKKAALIRACHKVNGTVVVCL